MIFCQNYCCKLKNQLLLLKEKRFMEIFRRMSVSMWDMCVKPLGAVCSLYCCLFSLSYFTLRGDVYRHTHTT